MRRPILVLFAFLAFSLGSAPTLRVYYRITPFDLKLTRVEANGERTPLSLPPQLRISPYGNRTPHDLLPRIEQAFREMVEGQGGRLGIPGAHYELTAHYSFNSPALDRRVTWRAPGADGSAP